MKAAESVGSLTEKDLSDFSKFGAWFKIANNAGYATSKAALKCLQSWCSRHNIILHQIGNVSSEFQKIPEFDDSPKKETTTNNTLTQAKKHEIFEPSGFAKGNLSFDQPESGKERTSCLMTADISPNEKTEIKIVGDEPNEHEISSHPQTDILTEEASVNQNDEEETFVFSKRKRIENEETSFRKEDDFTKGENYDFDQEGSIDGERPEVYKKDMPVHDELKKQNDKRKKEIDQCCSNSISDELLFDDNDSLSEDIKDIISSLEDSQTDDKGDHNFLNSRQVTDKIIVFERDEVSEKHFPNLKTNDSKTNQPNSTLPPIIVEIEDKFEPQKDDTRSVKKHLLDENINVAPYCPESTTSKSKQHDRFISGEGHRDNQPDDNQSSMLSDNPFEEEISVNDISRENFLPNCETMTNLQKSTQPTSIEEKNDSQKDGIVLKKQQQLEEDITVESQCPESTRSKQTHNNIISSRKRNQDNKLDVNPDSISCDNHFEDEMHVKDISSKTNLQHTDTKKNLQNSIQPLNTIDQEDKNDLLKEDIRSRKQSQPDEEIILVESNSPKFTKSKLKGKNLFIFRKTDQDNQGEDTASCDDSFEDDTHLNDISRETCEVSLGRKIPGKFFEASVPGSGYFYISDQDWMKMCKTQRGRCFSTGTWEHIIEYGIKQSNPYCVYMFKWHRVSTAQKRKRKQSAPLFRGEGVCKFKDCGNICKFSMTPDRLISLQLDRKVKHNITENHARPIRGVQRKNFRETFQNGQKPYKLYLSKFQDTATDIKIAGNFSNFGNTKQTFQKIASESNFSNILDKSEFESLVKMSFNMRNETPELVYPGFIRHISIMPPYIMYWSEMGIRIWHDMAKHDIVYWDATGTVISPRRDDSKFFYYELACRNPRQGECIIPVSSMISAIHSTSVIRFWLSEFRRSEKKIFGHANAVVPHQIISDRSMAFLQAGLSEFNNEDMNAFRSRAWRIINGIAQEKDLDGVFPHACLSHVMASFKRLSMINYKSNLEFGMYCFSLILNSTTLKEAEEVLISIYYVLLSRVEDKKTIEHLLKIEKKISELPVSEENDNLSSSEDNDNFPEDSQTMFAETVSPDRYTEEDYANRSSKNEFCNWSYQILQNVKIEISESIFVEQPGNKRYSPAVADKIHKLFMPTFPVWSNVLLGDLSRHGKTEIYSSVRVPEKIERSNNRIEKRFQVLKNIALNDRTTQRLDEFSAKLKEHVTSVQGLAIIHTAKKSKIRSGKSVKTIEENWEKKKATPKKPDIGKYQKAPQVKQKKAVKNSRKIQSKSDKPSSEQDLNSTGQKDSATVNKKKEGSIDHGTTKINQTKENSNKRGKDRKTMTKSTVGHSSNQEEQILQWNRRRLFEERELNFVKNHVTGLRNLGNSCWFGSVVTAMQGLDAIQTALDRYTTNMSTKMEPILKIMNKCFIGEDVPDIDIEHALIACQESHGLSYYSQNDAEEFFGQVIANIISTAGNNYMIKVILYTIVDDNVLGLYLYLLIKHLYFLFPIMQNARFHF